MKSEAFKAAFNDMKGANVDLSVFFYWREIKQLRKLAITLGLLERQDRD